jgi:hypothetical protein
MSRTDGTGVDEPAPADSMKKVRGQETQKLHNL